MDEVIVQTRLDPEFKSKWIEALRSGEYQQGVGSLRDTHPEYCNYCCLGVAADLIDPNAWIDGDAWVYGSRQYSSWLPNPIKNKIGLSEAEENKLMTKNDDGQSFALIADYIEENL